MLLKVDKIRIGEPRLHLEYGTPQFDGGYEEPIRFRKLQGVEQDAFHHSEHHRIRADTDGESQDSNYGEGRRFAKDACAVDQILPENLEPPDHIRVARLFLEQRRIPEASCGGEPGIVRGHAGSNILLNAAF